MPKSAHAFLQETSYEKFVFQKSRQITVRKCKLQAFHNMAQPHTALIYQHANQQLWYRKITTHGRNAYLHISLSLIQHKCSFLSASSWKMPVLCCNFQAQHLPGLLKQRINVSNDYGGFIIILFPLPPFWNNLSVYFKRKERKWVDNLLSNVGLYAKKVFSCCIVYPITARESF